MRTKTPAGFKKLKKYAQRLGVQVSIIPRRDMPGLGSEAVFNSVLKKIFVSRDTLKYPSLLVYATAHELGHALDYSRMKKSEREFGFHCAGAFNLWMAGEIFISKRRLKKLRTHILKRERVAWEHGHDILDSLGITLSKKKMDKIRNQALNSYIQLFERHLFS